MRTSVTAITEAVYKRKAGKIGQNQLENELEEEEQQPVIELLRGYLVV